jgi:hypothetical protein
VKHQQQRWIGTVRRTVCENRHARAGDIDGLLAIAGRDRRRHRGRRSQSARQHNDDGADAVALDHLLLSLSRSREFRRTDTIPGYGTISSNNGVTHGEAYALSRRPVALFDHAMDARGNRRTL